MEIKVEHYWIIFVIVLIIVGIIFAVVTRCGDKSQKIPFSVIFVAVIIISVGFTLALIWFTAEQDNLTDRDKQVLRILYGLMTVLVLIGIVWVILDLVRTKSDTKNVIKVSCDDEECTVETSTVKQEEVENMKTVTAVCDEDGCHSTGLTPKRSEQRINVEFLT